MQFKNLDKVLEAHKENELEFKKLEKIIEGQAKKIQELQKQVQAAAQPFITKGQKFEKLIQNNTLRLQKLIIKKHQLEGVIEQLGGNIPEETKLVLPDLIDEEELLNPENEAV